MLTEPIKRTAKIVKRTGLIMTLPAYIYGLKRATERGRGIRDWMDVAFKYRFRSLTIAPFQLESEFGGLLELVSEHRVERMLEIGTAQGGTLYLFCRVISPNAQVISLDLPGGFFGMGYPFWKIPLFQAF